MIATLEPEWLIIIVMLGVIIYFVSVISHGWDKYGGRFDGDVIYKGTNISAAMLAGGQAISI